MLYETVAQYDVAIADTIGAIERVVLIGENHINKTDQTEFSTNEASLASLEKRLERLRHEKRLLQGKRPVINIRCRW